MAELQVYRIWWKKSFAYGEKLVSTLRYTSNGSAAEVAPFGFNLIDVQSVEELDELPTGAKGLVWLDEGDGVTESFKAKVTPFIGHSKLFGFYLVDEPDPTGNWGRKVDAADLKAESDWIHARMPDAKTFITMMNMGSSADPDFSGTYNPSNTHIDLFGLDPYPVRSESSTVDYQLIDRTVAAALESGIPLSKIVPVYQTFGGGGWTTDTGGRYDLPTADEMTAMLDRWEKLVPAPVFDYAYSWGTQNGHTALEASTILQGIFRARNLDSDMPDGGPGDILLTSAPTVGNDVPTAGDTLGTLSSDIVGGVFSLDAGSSAGIAVSAAGVITATTAFGDNRAYTLNAVVTGPGGAFRETITIRTGSAAADTFVGNASDEIVLARGGDDTVSTAGGDNSVFGQSGNDILNGGGGRNQLFGGAGLDTLTGGDDNDTLDGGDEADQLTGGSGDDSMAGGAGADRLSGDAGADTLKGGAAGDILAGGAGADTIDTGATNDNVLDRIRFAAATQFPDRVTNFDANGTADRVEFGGTLNTAWDDGLADDNFLFISGNGGAGAVAATVGQRNANAEALRLTGVNGEGVISANLGSAAAVATAFNNEFTITASNGEDALLVVNDTNGNSFSAWQWIQAGGGETSGSELTLIGTFVANATVGAASFDFI